MTEDTRIMSDEAMDAAEAEAARAIAEARARPRDEAVERRISALMARPYRRVITGEPVEGYLAEAPELPGCVTAGETPEEALAMLDDAMRVWFEGALDHGDPIPDPEHLAERAYNGRILVRTTRTLHQQLVELAEREGVSLNQLAVVLLAQGTAGTAAGLAVHRSGSEGEAPETRQLGSSDVASRAAPSGR